jgi:hypothetical protein
MEIKNQILKALEALAPKIDKARGQDELDKAAIGISNLLSEPHGLELVEYISKWLEAGKKPLYSTNQFVEKSVFDLLNAHTYESQDNETLQILLRLYHQFWSGHASGGGDPKTLYRSLKKLETSSAIKSKKTISSICLNCYSQYDVLPDNCDGCNGNNFLEIYELSFPKVVRSVLGNNQYLELYIKECLKKSGVELIGWPIDKQGKKAYTSVQYQVDGDMIETDVHGIATPVALLLCEAKTANKVTLTDIRYYDGIYTKLVSNITEYVQLKSIKLRKIFVTTGEFDRNISIPAYQRRDWELLDRDRISHLVEEFKRIQQEL